MNVNVSSVLHILLDSEFSLPYFLPLPSNLECTPPPRLLPSVILHLSRSPVLTNPTPPR